MLRIRRILSNLWQPLIGWFDSHRNRKLISDIDGKDMDWVRAVPFIALHVAVFSVFLVGWSPVAVGMAVMLYLVRMFSITAFYHRYFSHRSFRTSRGMQFVFGLLGASAVQRGPLWWAANHRTHHIHSDQPADVHSPLQHSLLWSHVGWFLANDQLTTNQKRIKDFWRFPELRFLDRFDTLVPLGLAIGLFLFGALLESIYPSLGTNGWQMLVWGFVISTVVLWHGTFTINSLAHRFGTRRYATRDDSRNNWFLALITLGEGWHNNHHKYPSAARQGFRWWEVDITYYLLQGLQFCGLIWEIRPVPTWVLNQPSESELSEDVDSEQIAV